MPQDKYDFSRDIANSEHLTWTDHLRASIHAGDAVERGNYLQAIANQRKAEYDEEQKRLKASAQGQGASQSQP